MAFIIRILAPSDKSYKIHHTFYVRAFTEQLYISTVRKEAKRFDSQNDALAWWHSKDIKDAYRIEVLDIGKGD